MMAELRLDPRLQQAVARLSDELRRGPGAPFQVSEDLPVLREGLERVLCDRDYLVPYLRQLDRLLKRPLPYREVMSEQRQQEVCEHGLGCLEPRELTVLALNPHQLLDLRDTILDYFPEYWRGVARQAVRQAEDLLRLRIRDELAALVDASWREGQLLTHRKENRRLVNEIYVRWREDGSWGQTDSLRFFETAAVEMLRLLVERARRAVRQETRHCTSWAETAVAGSASVTLFSAGRYAEWLLDQDKNWAELGKPDGRIARVYSLFHFAGRTPQEIADLLGWEMPQVQDDLMLAEAVLVPVLTLAESASAPVTM
jgi:hypothetical protein